MPEPCLTSRFLLKYKNENVNSYEKAEKVELYKSK